MPILKTIKKRFFLKRHYPLPSTMELLQKLYPQIDWSRVEFYEGLPWFTHMVAPYVTAQALPDFYSFSKFRIYLLHFDERRVQCLADIVHEAYHVNQGMEFAKGYGIGFLRGLMIYYNAVFMKYGYRMNPFEIPAYDQEFRFLDYCAKHGYHGITPRLKDKALENIHTETSLVYKPGGYRYKENIVLLFLSCIFCITVAVLKPIADIILYIPTRLVRLSPNESQAPV